MDFTVLTPPGARLGESPVWDATAGCLWWLDIKSRILHRLDMASTSSTFSMLPEDPGSVVLARSGGMVVTMRNGVYRLAAPDADPELLVSLETALPENRFNDGRCDRQGRLVAGSMHEPQTRADAALYRVSGSGDCVRLLDGITTSNGLAWSEDGRTMYFADTLAYKVWAFDYDIASGTPSNKRVFVDLGEDHDFADGAAVDVEGCYWLAIPLRSEIRRYDPDGREMRRIRLPVSVPTCPVFGGENYETMFVTSASFSLSQEELARERLAGAVLAFDAGVRGLPETPFAC